MSALFKPSAETGKDFRAKVLVWGPPGAGKTHFGLGAPSPILIDVENRGRSFAARSQEFNFAHAEIETLEQLAEAFREIRGGKVAGESIVTDSGSAIYSKLVEEHTARADSGKYSTDWPLVNRRFVACLNFLFAIAGKNVIFTMHAATKLVRQGRDFRVDGLKFIGDDRFRFGFDYIFRIEPVGPPHEHRAVFHAEKSVSPHIRVGARLENLTWPKLVAIATGASPTLQSVARPSQTGASSSSRAEGATSAAPPPRTEPQQLQDDGTPIVTEQMDKIEVLSHRLQLGSQLPELVKRITRRTAVYREMTSAQASRLIAVLEQRLKDVA